MALKLDDGKDDFKDDDVVKKVGHSRSHPNVLDHEKTNHGHSKNGSKR